MAALNIANMYESAQKVEGVVRVNHPSKKTACNQSEYLAMDLSNITGSIAAFAWDNKYHSSYIPKENDIICIHGRTKILPISKEVAIDIYEILPVEKEVDNPISFMPLPAGVNKTNLQELIETIDELSSPSLKAFLYNVFSDETITNQFITGKASAEHHHSEYGGLLRHSLEVVRFVKRCTEIPHHELEVGITAAILHDIVKTTEYYNRGKSAPPMVNHNTRTLAMLDEPLKQLDESWNGGAGLLRICLECPLIKQDMRNRKIHMPAIADAVHFADQISAATYKEHMVSEMMEDWQQYMKYYSENYWRCPPEHINEVVEN
jgi:hypothetical protein